ncbi:MAG: DUF2550 domain-containing protein [Propionibacteriaceae bacterium]|jgi:hypothetical protein|nr:DUF2550 domain-containing protein [Propionibacteriaceae bacterium]
MMRWLEYLPVLVAISVGVCVCIIAGLFIRRRLLTAGGGIFDCGMRKFTAQRSKPWSLGMARYLGDEFLWYRAFSLSASPVFRLNRRVMRLKLQRQVVGEELLELPFGDFVVSVASGVDATYYDLAMSAGSALGLTTWLEAGPRSDITMVDLAWH